MRRLLTLAVLPILLAADTPADRLAKLRARHNATMQAVVEVY